MPVLSLSRTASCAQHSVSPCSLLLAADATPAGNPGLCNLHTTMASHTQGRSAHHRFAERSNGAWVHLPEVTGPPYLLDHLHDAHRARVAGCSKRWPGLFQWGWEDGAAEADQPPAALDS